MTNIKVIGLLGSAMQELFSEASVKAAYNLLQADMASASDSALRLTMRVLYMFSLYCIAALQAIISVVISIQQSTPTETYLICYLLVVSYA